MRYRFHAAMVRVGYNTGIFHTLDGSRRLSISVNPYAGNSNPAIELEADQPGVLPARLTRHRTGPGRASGVRPGPG